MDPFPSKPPTMDRPLFLNNIVCFIRELHRSWLVQKRGDGRGCRIGRDNWVANAANSLSLGQHGWSYRERQLEVDGLVVDAKINRTPKEFKEALCNFVEAGLDVWWEFGELLYAPRGIFYHWEVSIYNALHIDLHKRRSTCRLVSIKFGIEKLPQFQANRLYHLTILTPAVIDRISTRYIYGIRDVPVRYHSQTVRSLSRSSEI